MGKDRLEDLNLYAARRLPFTGEVEADLADERDSRDGRLYGYWSVRRQAGGLDLWVKPR